MFNSHIFLNCFHLVLSVLFLGVSGCWHGFSWVQRHSLCYTFCIQPFAVKTKLWEKNKQSNPYKNIWPYGLSITLAGKYLMNVLFQFFFWRDSRLNSGLEHLSRKWLEASGLKENQNYISGKLSKSIVFLQFFIEILLEYAGDSLL